MSIKKARKTLQNKEKFNYDILDKVANSGGDTAVRISFAADGDNLQNILKRHFASVKGG